MSIRHKILFTLLFLTAALLSLSVSPGREVFAQGNITGTGTPQEVFYRAKVEKILEEGTDNSFGFSSPYQKFIVTILDGDMKGQGTTIEFGKGFNLDKNQLVAEGETVIISKTNGPDGMALRVVDKYRLDNIKYIIAAFFLLIILLSGKKGIGSIVGMVLSLIVILKYIIPNILSGQDPLLVSIIGSFIIMVTTIYLAHGFSVQTTIALLSTFLTLLATGFLSVFFVQITHLSGLGTEDAAMLKIDPSMQINFRGLLLGGIIIGALGVLDDVTTGLTASIFELSKANTSYGFTALFRSGLRIGKEHIASLVNTLVLAYAGASLPIFITIVLNPNRVPLPIILNDGLIVEEVVRTLAGSIGLVVAVPLTTLLACYYSVKIRQY